MTSVVSVDGKSLLKAVTLKIVEDVAISSTGFESRDDILCV